MPQRIRPIALAIGLPAVTALLMSACSSGSQSPTSPSTHQGSGPLATTASADAPDGTAVSGAQRAITASAPGVMHPFGMRGGDAYGPLDIAFPPRNEPFEFRLRLETKYRDELRRRETTTFVDLEGDIVWTQEYLRYRVNECTHEQAVERVMAQIEGGVVQPVCGNPPPGPIAFPPRNEPFQFRQQLEAKYRDGLRRTAIQTYVDLEGDIVWCQEYLRYRLNNCNHGESVDRVFMQIEGRGMQPVCGRN